MEEVLNGQSLWVPETFAKNSPVLWMSAEFRGDMYHVRAALPLLKYSVCLYNSTEKTKGLEDYLSQGVNQTKTDIFIVRWDRVTLKGKSKPSSINGCYLNGKQIQQADIIRTQISKLYSLHDATRRIAQQATMPPEIVTSMFSLENDIKRKLGTGFKELCANTWSILPNATTILVLYRDTGTTGGAYPELDTGPFMSDIREAIKYDKSIKILMSGNSQPVDEFPTIGKYWQELEKLDYYDSAFARDIEAYFLKWAFDNKYYRLAIGFRSGALDLFTFLGIPTVSVGLRYFVGESRHALLAKTGFKRLNIQYDQPRHNTTACVKPLAGVKVPPLKAPFWLDAAPDGVKARARPSSPDEEKRWQGIPPASFANFDLIVLKIGLRMACHEHLKIAGDVSQLKDMNTVIIGTDTARYCYPDDQEDDGVRREYFKSIRLLDIADIENRNSQDRRYSLQESGETSIEYERASERGWDDVSYILDYTWPAKYSTQLC